MMQSVRKKPTGMGMYMWILPCAAAIILAISGLTLAEGGPQYVGAKKCKICHKPQYEIWLNSPHFGAFDKLPPEEQENDECVACHVTGFGKPAAPNTDLKDVQCEACHGPGSLYKKISIMSKAKYKADPEKQRKLSIEAGLVLPDESTCRSCHNEKSPEFKGFDFEEYKAKIKHWDLD